MPMIFARSFFRFKKMNYIQYTFSVIPPEPGSDILIALLADLGFESFSNTDTGFEGYIQEEFDNEEDIKIILLGTDAMIH